MRRASLSIEMGAVTPASPSEVKRALSHSSASYNLRNVSRGGFPQDYTRKIYPVEHSSSMASVDRRTNAGKRTAILPMRSIEGLILLQPTGHVRPPIVDGDSLRHPGSDVLRLIDMRREPGRLLQDDCR